MEVRACCGREGVLWRRHDRRVALCEWICSVSDAPPAGSLISL